MEKFKEGQFTMVNSTVNGKKIGKPAGQNDNAKITACEIIQKARNELQEEWTLDAKGILHKRVMESLNKKMNLDDKESYPKKQKAKTDEDLVH
jgi:hypothetical protein